jgi:hypothetical protein
LNFLLRFLTEEITSLVSRARAGKAAIRMYLTLLEILVRCIDHVPDRIIGDAGYIFTDAIELRQIP